MAISMSASRKVLALVWFIGAGITFLALYLITTFGAGERVEGLWDWYLPAVTPNLSLIVGVMFSDIKYKPARNEPVDVFSYRLALWLSVVYLLVLLATPLLSPFTEAALDLDLKNSRFSLSLLQALATTALGAFYVRQKGKP
jgi:uncharacterized membrane protein